MKGERYVLAVVLDDPLQVVGHRRTPQVAPDQASLGVEQEQIAHLCLQSAAAPQEWVGGVAGDKSFEH